MDDEAPLREKCTRGRVLERAASKSNDRRWTGDDLSHRLGFGTPELGFAQDEELLHGLSGQLLDVIIGVVERPLQRVCKTRADAGLAGAHEPNERDVPIELPLARVPVTLREVEVVVVLHGLHQEVS